LPNTKNQLDRLDPLIWKITAVAVLGSLMGQVDATVVNISLSSLAVDLHSSLTTVQWVTSGYLLALALRLPMNGWLVGQLGAKSVVFSAGAHEFGAIAESLVRLLCDFLYSF